MSDAFEKAHEGDLYALLSLCTNEELAPLVKIITSKFGNFLTIDDKYKKFNPNHSEYHYAIGNAIRGFGGNILSNTAHNGEGPPYAEIVSDVCKKLGVPHDGNNITVDEDNIRKEYFKKIFKWRTNKYTFNISNDLTPDVTQDDFVFYCMDTIKSDPEIPLTPLDPSFETTTPCVLHIAYLRHKILEEKRGVQMPRSDTAEAESSPASGSPVIAAQEGDLVVESEDGTPLLSLSLAPIPTPQGGDWHEIDHKNSMALTHLSLLMQAAPTVGMALNASTTQHMKIDTDGKKLKLMNAIGGGSRGITVDDKGKIIGQVRLSKDSTLTTIISATAIFNVATFLCAQKHLADIGQKLETLKDSVSKIAKFQQNERRAVLSGSLRYLEQIASSVMAGDLEDRFLTQLEYHEASLLKIQDHLMSDIRNLITGIARIEDTEWFGSSELPNKLHQRQEELFNLYQEIFFCLRARAFCWQLLCVFPVGETNKKRRKADILAALDELREDGPLLSEMDDAVRKKVREITSRVNSTATIQKRRLDVLNGEEALIRSISHARSETTRQLRAAAKMLTAIEGPVAIELRIENGTVTGARQA